MPTELAISSQRAARARGTTLFHFFLWMDWASVSFQRSTRPHVWATLCGFLKGRVMICLVALVCHRWIGMAQRSPPKPHGRLQAYRVDLSRGLDVPALHKQVGLLHSATACPPGTNYSISFLATRGHWNVFLCLVHPPLQKPPTPQMVNRRRWLWPLVGEREKCPTIPDPRGTRRTLSVGLWSPTSEHLDGKSLSGSKFGPKVPLSPVSLPSFFLSRLFFSCVRRTVIHNLIFYFHFERSNKGRCYFGFPSHMLPKMDSACSVHRLLSKMGEMWLDELITLRL